MTPVWVAITISDVRSPLATSTSSLQRLKTKKSVPPMFWIVQTAMTVSKFEK